MHQIEVRNLAKLAYDGYCKQSDGRSLISGAVVLPEHHNFKCRAMSAEAERDAALARAKAIEKILDDHTDYEGPMPGTGDYVGGVDPGALDLLRPKR